MCGFVDGGSIFPLFVVWVLLCSYYIVIVVVCLCLSVCLYGGFVHVYVSNCKRVRVCADVSVFDFHTAKAKSQTESV